MKAISLKQPWATLVCWGIKTVETRSWKTNYTGRVYIHASKKFVKNDRYLLLTPEFKKYGEFDPSKFVTGGIIGCVDIIGCAKAKIWRDTFLACNKPADVERESILGDLSGERFVFMLKNPLMFDSIIACRGTVMPLLWPVSQDIQALISEAKAYQFEV